MLGQFYCLITFCFEMIRSWSLLIIVTLHLYINDAVAEMTHDKIDNTVLELHNADHVHYILKLSSRR